MKVLAPVFAVFVLTGLLEAESAPRSKPEVKPTEITSDRLQLQKGGEETFFQGDVLLKQVEQWIRADEMTRSRVTGIAHARGHVRGTWFSPKGEKVIGTGDTARYNPVTDTTDLWGKDRQATITRWQTEADTAPVVIHAQHFVARQTENVMLADGHVVIVQTPRFEGHSERARYDRAADTLEMWGDTRVTIHLTDAKGTGDFIADRAWMSLNPKVSRLTGNVRGHVIPAGAS